MSPGGGEGRGGEGTAGSALAAHAPTGWRAQVCELGAAAQVLVQVPEPAGQGPRDTLGEEGCR